MALARFAGEMRRAGRAFMLVAALAEYKPYLRGAPPGLPFLWDSATLTRGLLPGTIELHVFQTR